MRDILLRDLISMCVVVALCGCQSDPASPGTDTETPPSPPAECLTLPAPDGRQASLLKTPYLLAPRADGVTVAFESLEGVSAWIGVWEPGAECLTALVEAPPSQLDPTLRLLGEVIPMDAPPGYQHAAHIEGLKPGLTYQYQVVMGDFVGDKYMFRAPPAPGQDYRLGIIGDTRTHDADHQRVIDALSPYAPDMVVHTGDLMTTAGILDDWIGFFAIEAELLARAPFIPAFGNHEAVFGHSYWAGYIHVTGAYKPEERRNYAFAYGDSYWIVWDSATALDEPRIDWIIARLEDAEAYPYRFVVFHHPFYSFSKHTPNAATRDRLHPLFVRHGVTAVWNGHNHCYEHFLVDGVHYLVVGGGGSSLYSIDSHIVEDLVPNRLKARSTHHFVVAERTDEHMQVTIYDVDRQEVLETFTLDPSPVQAPTR